jgi:hypothetical protein
MSKDNIKLIEDWSIPKSIKDLQLYLGFANFY